MNKWLQRVEQMALDTTAGMTQAELEWHPEGRWSSAEILEHLFKTYNGTRRAFEKVEATGAALGGSPTLKQRLQAFVVTGIGYFPPGRKSPKMVLPTGGLSGHQARDTFFAELRGLMTTQAKVEHRFAGTCIADHPILGPFTLQQWSRFHYVHARHHMKQIAALRARMATAKSQSA